MALICMTGTRECTGCKYCEHVPQRIGNCEHCSDTITDCEEYYNIEGILLHEECLQEYMSKYLVK